MIIRKTSALLVNVTRPKDSKNLAKLQKENQNYLEKLRKLKISKKHEQFFNNIFFCSLGNQDFHQRNLDKKNDKSLGDPRKKYEKFSKRRALK